MAASLRSDSPAATARSLSPAARIPTESEIENIIYQATASARAANGGRSPVVGRDTRTQLFVGNLPYRVRWQDLKDLFRKAGGTVLRADVSLGPDNRSRGYGTVLLGSAEDAGRAIDMFNGYVWQTRTLEVRPDRLPNDFDMGMASNNLPPLTKMASPQMMQYNTSMNMAPTSIHPLSMSTSSNSSLQPSMMAPSLSMQATSTSTSTMPQSLPMGGGLGAPQMDSTLSGSGFSTETVRPNGNGLDGIDIIRSTSAFKALPPTMPSSSSTAPSGVSDVLSYSQIGGAGASSFGTHAVNDYSSNRGSSASGRSDSPDHQGKKIYVSNLPVQYTTQDLQHMFQAAGTIVKLSVSPGEGLDGVRNATLIYYSKEEAQAAIEKYNGLTLNGRILRVQIANADLSFSQSNGSQNDNHFNPQSPTASTGMNGMNGTNAMADPYRYPYMIMNTMGTMGTMPSLGSMSNMANMSGMNGMNGMNGMGGMGAPPQMPGGYPLGSPPQSPYDPYPPNMNMSSMSSMGYPIMPALPSPSSAYPPPMPSGVYYSWHHRPSSPGPGAASSQLAPSTSTSIANHNHNPTSSSSASTSAAGLSTTTTAPSTGHGSGFGVSAGGTGAQSTSMNMGNSTTNGNSGSSTGSRAGPGPIALPGPANSYAPAPISPMHGLPPITPSMPSFTFMPQPLPTPPLHPHYLSPGPYPHSPPGYYRPTMNPYFNLSPGPPVHYHHDANAVANNGAIGSGAPGAPGAVGPAGSLVNGTPYFDRTVATAGSDVPHEYFPPMPMPITNSITGALAAMNLNSTSNSGPLGPIAESEASQLQGKGQGQAGAIRGEEAAPFLEPVGVGSDGFASLSADPSSIMKKSTSGSAGLSDWVVSPDDLPVQSQSQAQSQSQSPSYASTTSNSVAHTTASSPGPNATSGGYKMMAVKTYSPPRRHGNSLTTTPLNERSVSADPTPTTSTSTSKAASNAVSNSHTPSGPASPKGPDISPSKGAIYSSTNKPKLSLGPMFPRPFNIQGKPVDAAAANASNAANGANGVGAGAGAPDIKVSSANQYQHQSGQSAQASEMAAGGGGSEPSAFAALKINGTPNGFRDSLGVDPEAGGMRRASWTEDASRRQTIVAGLANSGDQYGRHM